MVQLLPFHGGTHRRPLPSQASDRLRRGQRIRGRDRGRRHLPLSLLHIFPSAPQGTRFPPSPSKVDSYRPAFPGRSIFAEGATRTLCSFRSPPSGRFATFGGKCPGCSIIRTFLTVVLMVSLPRYGSLCHLRWQQPTGLTLPFGAGRAGSLRPWAQTFLKHLAEKIAAGELFRQPERPLTAAFFDGLSWPAHLCRPFFTGQRA